MYTDQQLPDQETAADRDLLRRFEPVVRYNAGENFFPMDVAAYVKECSLWVQYKGTAPEEVIEEGNLSLDDIVNFSPNRSDAVTFLKFIEPLNITELARHTLSKTIGKKDPREVFKAGRGRLARVGYVSRFVDALFSLSLFARGRVPGDTAAAAGTTYKEMMQKDEHYSYYGRVVRRDGWIALQYWYFYAYNSWRSGYFGVNDHESDWEQVCIYCYEDDDGQISPEWVAYASHDFSGDDLRRHWTDSTLDKVGDHPVIYAGAGSHASYYERGEYLAEIELPFLKPLVRLAEQTEKMRHEALERYQDVKVEEVDIEANIFRIPFVDYAHGDGYGIGEGEERQWSEPEVISSAPRWVSEYRGLWGLYTRDPLSGEDAPAGPMYNRNGSVRQAWYDPIGWAGLNKVAPPNLALQQIEAQYNTLLNRRTQIEEDIEQKHLRLVELGTSIEAMRGHPHMKVLFEKSSEELQTITEELKLLSQGLTQDDALRHILEQHGQHLEAGGIADIHSHIIRAHHPISDEGMRTGRIAELWAAASIGVAMIAFVALVATQPDSFPYTGFLTLAILFIIIEAGFRRRLHRIATGVSIILALIALLILIIDFFKIATVLLVLGIGGYILWENFRELFRR